MISRLKNMIPLLFFTHFDYGFMSQTTMELGLHVYTIHQNGEFRDDGSVFAVHTTGVKPPPLPWPRHDFVLPHRPHGAQKGGGRGQQKGRDRGGGLLHQEMGNWSRKNGWEHIWEISDDDRILDMIIMIAICYLWHFCDLDQLFKWFRNNQKIGNMEI